MDQRIISAIQSKLVLSLIYEGFVTLRKQRPFDFEPYTYGRLVQGQDFVLGWQRASPSRTWRVMQTNRMRDLRVTGQTFEAPHPGLLAAMTTLGHVAAIYCQIEGVPAPPLAVLHT